MTLEFEVHGLYVGFTASYFNVMKVGINELGILQYVLKEYAYMEKECNRVCTQVIQDLTIIAHLMFGKTLI